MSKGKSFIAMAQGEVDYGVDVICINSEEFGDMMTIMAQEGAFYITKDQAHKFFFTEEATVIFNGVEHLVIGKHPLKPVVVLERPDNTFVTVTLDVYLKLEEKYL